MFLSKNALISQNITLLCISLLFYPYLIHNFAKLRAFCAYIHYSFVIKALVLAYFSNFTVNILSSYS